MPRTAIAPLVLTVAALLFAASVTAQQGQDFSKVQIQTTELGHQTYMLQGAGGNMTLAVGTDGAILVDSEFAPLHDKIKAAIGKLTSVPVRYVIDTHFHTDHAGGNAPFAQEGAVIVAQVNARKRLAEGATNGLTGAKSAPAPTQALPTKTYDETMTLRVGGRTAQLVHVPNAHTDGDTYVYFKDANVLATGDIVGLGSHYPNIDVANGGGIQGTIDGVSVLLKVGNPDTKIVPGHGPLATRADLIAYRQTLITARDRVAQLIKQGKSLDETVAARPLADLDPKYGKEGSDTLVRLVYSSLKSAPAGVRLSAP